MRYPGPGDKVKGKVVSRDRHSTNNVILISGATAFWNHLNVRDTADIHRVEAARYKKSEIADHLTSQDWVILGEPLFWHPADRTVAYINKRFFSDINVVDLTSLGESVNVGRIKAELLEEMSCEQIIHFLLSSSLMRTFIHSHSELRLIKCTGGKSHLQRYDASHFMYTNEEICLKYTFEVIIDTQSGVISVGP